MSKSRLVRHMVREMTIWGAFGGLGLGVIYGVIIATIVFVKMSSEGNSIFNILLLIILLAIPFGTTIGGALGLFAGTILGLLNGLIVSVLTQIAFFPLTNEHQYRTSIGLISVIFSLVGGIIVFGFIIFSPTSRYFLEYAFIPTIIAAFVNAYGSQQVGKWYIAAVAKAD